MTRYGTVVADPPWPVEWHGGGLGRHRSRAGLGYPTLAVEAIAALPVEAIAADDAALFLWITPRLNREGVGVAVARAWGFDVVSEFVWSKGMIQAGGWPRVCHELVLVGRRGRFRFPSAALHSVQHWRREPYAHSAKPPGLLDLAELVAPSPRVELFARRHRLGWDVWGNESANTAALDVAI